MPRLLTRIAGTTAILTAIVAPVTAGDLRVTGKLISDNLSGPPIQVLSGDKVFNLNADLIDGMNAADFAAVADLKMPGSGTEVHWKNLTGIPIKSIDQQCAEFEGCFTGDTPGFPVTITEPGSYRLTSNLDIRHLPTPEGIDVIKIQSSNVVLDLSGFAIIGVVTCTNTPATDCSPTGSTGDGVEIANTGLDSIVIRNGTTRGMGRRGIVCDSRCVIEDMSISENGNDGIKVSSGSIVRGVYAYRNHRNGIRASGVIAHNRSEGNGDSGIISEGASIVTNNTANNNDLMGIYAFGSNSHSRFANNTASSNRGSGLRIVGGSATVTGNTLSNNDFAGLTCSTCLIRGNIMTANGDFGLHIWTDSTSTYGGNMIHANTTGSIKLNSGATLLDQGQNFCDGAVC